MTNIPDLQPEVKEHLKSERLQAYAARIFQVQMDIAAYEALGQMQKAEMAGKQLTELITAYNAVAVM